MEIMRNSRRIFLCAIVFSSLVLLLRPASATTGPDFDFGSQPRFVCIPVPAHADPACFPSAGPNHQSAPPPTGWQGASDEAKTTILHLRESLVQQKETILDQRETIRELTAKLALCEGLGRGAVTPHDEHQGPHHGPHLAFTENRHHGVHRLSHHGDGNHITDSPHHPSAGRHSHNNHHHGKDKAVTSGDASSSPEQMERMLHALKDRLDNLQKRNTSITSSGSLKELLQRKISVLEQQLHHRSNSKHSGPHHHRGHTDHHDDDDDDDDEDDDDEDDNDHHADEHQSSHKDDHSDTESHGDHTDTDGDDDDDHGDHGDDDDDDDEGHHSDEDGNEDDEDDDEDDEDDDDDDEGNHSNEADSQSYLHHTGYRAPRPWPGFHSNKLEMMLNQLHHTGSNRRKAKSPDTFQISFPMRTNYMYGRMKKTLMNDIFALTLCLWIKAGAGPGLGTPFSYSAPGQANELVLIEWGNNPMELLIDDKAVTLPLSLGDGKWHHVCVTWSTRDGQWEAYQDGVQRGSGVNLSPWHPIKAGGVFILGQEQDTLGGRFDASQSFVGEMSDLHMWSHVLTPSDIDSLASCGSHLRGDVLAWSEAEVELRGGVAKYPFDPCH